MLSDNAHQGGNDCPQETSPPAPNTLHFNTLTSTSSVFFMGAFLGEVNDLFSFLYLGGTGEIFAQKKQNVKLKCRLRKKKDKLKRRGFLVCTIDNSKGSFPSCCP